jgi:hypothetical protein
MVEEEKIKKMAKFRTILEKRVQDMETELEGLRALLGFVDDILLEGGFKRVKIDRPASSVLQPSEKLENFIPIKTVTGVLLANLFIKENSMHIILAKERQFNIHTSPFTSFFVERVLMKMQEKDQEAMRNGEITPEQMLTYNISRDGDFIREIIIRNTTPERLRELRSTIRWTLEKMYEKTENV